MFKFLKDSFNKIKSINQPEEIKEEIIDEMYHLSIKDGTLIYPLDWYVLNRHQANTFKYAGVVTYRNCEKYDLPYLVFLTDKKYSFEYTDKDIEEIKKLCLYTVEKDFTEIFDLEIEPILDEKGAITNKEDWEKAPSLNFFSIYEDGDPKFGPNYMPPNNAKIIRN